MESPSPTKLSVGNFSWKYGPNENMRPRKKKKKKGWERVRSIFDIFFFFFHGIDESSWAGIDGEAQKDREKCREPFFFHFMFHILHIRLWLGDRCADWMVKAWVFVQGWRVKSRFFSNKRESKLIFDMIFEWFWYKNK